MGTDALTGGDVEVVATGATADVVEDPSGIGLVSLGTSDHVNENTLSCCTLSDESEDLSGLQSDRDVIENDFAVERFGYIFDFKEFDSVTCHAWKIHEALLKGAVTLFVARVILTVVKSNQC